MQGKETSGKGTKGKLTIMFLSTTRLSYISSLPLHLLLLLSILLLLLIILPLLLIILLLFLIIHLIFLLLQEVWKALPPLLQKPVGQALECLHTSLVSSSPQVPK